MAVLIVVAGDERGREVVLPQTGELVIGRALGDVNFSDGRLSRKHCSLCKGSDGYMIKDLDSTNGVFVNGQRVRESILKLGDKVRLGYTVFEFQDGNAGDLPSLDVEEEVEEEPALDVPDAKAGKAKRSAHGKSRIMAAKFAAMGKEPLTASKRLISAKGRFCEACSAVISPDDLEAGRAKRLEGLFLCESCVAVVENKKIAPKDVVRYLKWKEQEKKATEPEADSETGQGLDPVQ